MSLAGIIDPENRCSFPFDRATLPAKKGAAVSPLNCRVKIPLNQPNKENNRLIRIFCQRGHCFYWAKKHLRPFAKRSVLRAYLRYDQTCTIRATCGGNYRIYEGV